MPFPTSERVVFEQNPLAEVICQLRFPPILQISSSAPAEFQDRVRAEYPLYRRETQIEVPEQFRKVLERSGLLGPLQSSNHRFLTADEKRSITLNAEYLALSESEYTKWEAFKAELDTARAALADVYAPAFYTRVGLRYIDVIDRKTLGLTDVPWSKLINSDLRGALGAEPLEGRVLEIQTEALLTLDSGQAKIRHGLARRDGEHQIYVIDGDYFTSERTTGADVLTHLDSFNRIAGDFFRWAITPELKAALKPVAID